MQRNGTRRPIGSSSPTLVFGFFAIALLLVTIYPSPMHLLRLY